MGRKPNQLILEFFDRGPKLEDASNRYQHTCKACGEHFPKGRIDSLTTHLTKKCQAIPMEDRRRALLQLHEMPVHMAASEQDGPVLEDTTSTVKLPTGSSRKLYGLEALAEASRQVESSGLGHISREDDSAIDPNLRALTPWEAQLHEKLENAIAPSNVLGPDALPAPGFSDSNSPSLTKGHPYPSAVGDENPSTLSLIAASAIDSDTVVPDSRVDEDQQSPTQPSQAFMSPPGLRSVQPVSSWESQDIAPRDSSQDQAAAKAGKALAFHRVIAMSPPRSHRNSTEHEVSLNSPRTKVRGKFSDTRRKEVQEVRKKGACIRCRMLRKTCSGGDPCNSCSSVESARVWKHPCMRTRLAYEFELYGAALYSTLALHQTNQVKSQTAMQEYSGQVEITHDLNRGDCISCHALTGRSESSQHNGYLDGEAHGPNTFEDITILVDSTDEDLPTKVDLYAKRLAPLLYNEEPSIFMNSTLSLASKLSIEKNDMLLFRILELWTITHILVDAGTHWQMFLIPDSPESNSDENRPLNPEQPLPIDQDNNPRNYEVIGSQLRAATEQKASVFSKAILNDFERRLLQRSQCQGFETFLAAVILLSCVEKMCWLYQTWDDEQLTAKWPLDNRPAHYTRQGESFSDLIHMLLRMRGVPRKTKIDPDTGYLHVVNGDDPVASQWFDSVKLTNTYLEERRATVFDPADSRSWELKFCSKLFLLAA